MVVIDQRERAPENERLVSELIKRRKWEPGQLGVKTHNVLDIIFEQQGVTRAGFERKIASDVLASHRDGRMQEQLARIVDYANEHSDVVLGYLIEGDLEAQEYGQQNASHIKHELWGLSKLGITVVYTRSLDETCEYLIYMRTQFGRALSVEQARAEASENRLQFKGKKREVKEQDFLFQVLRIIGGVSPKHARAIADKHESVHALAEAFYGDKHLLVGIKIAENRKIGKDLSAKIYRMFLGEPKEGT